MADRPVIFPHIDKGNTNQIDWELTPLQTTGFAPGVTIPSDAHNTAWSLGALWMNYLDYQTVHTGDTVSSASAQRWSSTRLAYTIGGDVDGAGAAVDTYGTYFVGGYRIEIDDGLLNPANASPLIVGGATTPGRVWVYLQYGVISPPGQPVASIRVESAGVAAAASPAAGELALVGVDIDAAGLVTGNVYDGSDPDYAIEFAGPDWNLTNDLNFTNATGSTLALGPNGAGIEPLVVNPETGVSCVWVQGNGTESAVYIDGDGGHGIEAITDSASNYAIIGTNDGNGAGIRGVSTGNGAGGSFQGGVIGAGVVATGGSSSGSGGVFTGGAGGGAGAACTAVGANPGVQGLGAFDADSVGVYGVAGHTDALGVHGISHTNGISSAAGVYGQGRNDAAGVHGEAADGHGVVCESDGNRAPLRIISTAGDPTVASVTGGLWFNAILDRLRWKPSSGTHSIHSSEGGWVREFDDDAANTGLVGGVNLASCTIDPETTGDVLVTGTIHLTPNTSTAQVEVYLRQSGSTIVQQTEYAHTANEGFSVIIRAKYTLPSSASRTFDLRLDVSSGSWDYKNAVVSVEGVQA